VLRPLLPSCAFLGLHRAAARFRGARARVRRALAARVRAFATRMKFVRRSDYFVRILHKLAFVQESVTLWGIRTLCRIPFQIS
jgi:hypothetical protein